MHRTPGRDACRRTRPTLEGCQPFERVTSAFLLSLSPFHISVHIFLLITLLPYPPEYHRGREIPPRGMQNCFESSKEGNSLFAENSRGFIRKSVDGVSCVTLASYSFQLRELGQSFILRELSVPSSLDWPSPSFEESFPTPSKVIDDDKVLPSPNRRLSRVVPSTRIPQIPNSLRSSPIFSAVKSIVGGDLSRAMGSRPTKARAGNSGSRNYRHFFPRPRNLPLKCRFRITSRHGSL